MLLIIFNLKLVAWRGIEPLNSSVNDPSDLKDPLCGRHPVQAIIIRSWAGVVHFRCILEQPYYLLYPAVKPPKLRYSIYPGSSMVS